MPRRAGAMMALPALAWAAAAAANSRAGSFLGRAEDPCACLNWKEAYSSKAARCGNGFEFTPAHEGKVTLLTYSMMGDEFCNKFFKRIDDNFCMNMAWSHNPGTWCYVSSECASAAPLNGTGSARAKRCTEGKDALLRDKSPEELYNWSRTHDFEVAILAKMAYPVEKQTKWNVARSLLRTVSQMERAGNPESSIGRLIQLRDTQRPVVLDSSDGHPPFGVMVGSKAYAIELNKVDSDHPSQITSWMCYHGCHHR